MLQIAVTGGIACGKSSVGNILSDRGATVRDTDDMVHHLVMQDSAVSHRVVDEFGDGILDEEGLIDRATLGDIVFSDSGAMQRLNRIVHPAVKAMCRQWLAEREAEDGIAVLIVPLLYEAGMAAGWDAIVCVACSRFAQLQRLGDRGLSVQQAEQRIAAQMTLSRKMRLADYVIFNDHGKSLMERQTEIVMNSIRERKAW